jgi:anti-sigma factor RsiW
MPPLTTWTDETLMAFADGELGPAEAASVAAAAATDAALAARIDTFRASRARIATLRIDTPPPDALVARIRALDAAGAAAPSPAAQVLPFTPRPRAPMWQLPLAACVALLAGLAIGAFLPRTDDSAGTGPAILAMSGLDDALAALASGDSVTLAGGARLTAISSFETETGDLCREIEIAAPQGTTTAAIACRAPAGWETRLALVAEGGADGYAPAGSLDALDAWLAANGAGAPLSPGEEAARLAAD